MIGRQVYVGWCPDVRTGRDAREARCSIATIIAGPFESGSKVRGIRRRLRKRSWIVERGGERYIAAEYLLQPFDDPDYERSTSAREIHA